MKLDTIRKKVCDVPHMLLEQAETMTELILEKKFENILELGFRHGVSTCYMAGALDELGRGHITTIDLEGARQATPSIENLLGDLGLSKYVTIHFEPTSYIWRLMKMLEDDPTPRFDFCYIDGAHNWSTDGFAFFLVDRLLKPGGMIIFDDLDWTYQSSPTLSKTEMVIQMPEDEKNTPQVRKVYELLVKTHPSYVEFSESGHWAYAHKCAEKSNTVSNVVRKEVVYQQVQVGLGAVLMRVLNKIRRR